jgi:ribosome biogenesis GTPase A
MQKPREWLREKSIAKQVLKDANVILEVVDARIPLETRNKVVEELAKERNKEVIIVLNKTDLVPKNFLKKAKEEIEKEHKTVLFSATNKKGINELMDILKKVAKQKKIIKVGVLGYPNVGKSSLINALKKRKIATTSPKPGMTRGKQLIKLDDSIFLIDTPGIITLELPEDLALKGSWIPDKLEDPTEVAVKLLEKIIKKSPNALEELYKIEISQNPVETLEMIGDKLNFKIKGGAIDYDRTAKKVLWDWLKGNLKAYWLE